MNTTVEIKKVTRAELGLSEDDVKRLTAMTESARRMAAQGKTITPSEDAKDFIRGIMLKMRDLGALDHATERLRIAAKRLLGVEL